MKKSRKAHSKGKCEIRDDISHASNIRNFVTQEHDTPERNETHETDETNNHLNSPTNNPYEEDNYSSKQRREKISNSKTPNLRVLKKFGSKSKSLLKVHHPSKISNSIQTNPFSNFQKNRTRDKNLLFNNGTDANISFPSIQYDGTFGKPPNGSSVGKILSLDQMNL